jgi:hypothetical protein
MVAVMRRSAVTRSTSAGSNLGSTIISPPLTIVGTKNAAPACDSGVSLFPLQRADREVAGVEGMAQQLVTHGHQD